MARPFNHVIGRSCSASQREAVNAMKNAESGKAVTTLSEEVSAKRSAAHDVLPLFLNRWSPRSMTGEPLRDEELLSLFEAARWAPSSYNGQPWRFIIAKRENRRDWERLFGLLIPGNQNWAQYAGLLVVVVSRTLFEHDGRPSATHAFDAGAAWENLALEAARRGLVAHAMQGFDYERAREELGVPGEFEVDAMIAIGKRGPKENLSERLQAMEEPNERRPMREILFEGKFGVPAVRR
jgi:nitroreductase